MKRLFAIMMALAMMLSLGVTAFAEGDDNTPVPGSITVTNAEEGKTYEAYKIFDATLTEGGISYTIVKDTEMFRALFEEETKEVDGKVITTYSNPYFTYTPIDDTYGAVAIREDYVEAEHKTALVEYLMGIVDGMDSDAEEVAGTGPVEFKNLPYGYYVITSSLGTTVTIDSTRPHADVQDKNQTTITFNKKVDNADNNTVKVGDTVTFEVTFNAPNYLGTEKITEYNLHDALSSEWAKINLDSIAIKVDNQDLENGTDYTVSNGTTTGFDINIPWVENPEDETSDFLYEAPSQVTITYTAVVQDIAVAADPNTTAENEINKNTATLTWDNGTATDETTTKTFNMGFTKVDGSNDNAPLANAEFKLYSDSGCTQEIPVKKITEGVYTVTTDTENATTIVTPEDGQVVIMGLDVGTEEAPIKYWLKETKAPDGYNLMANAKPVELGDASVEFESDDYVVNYDADVVNNKGAELPSTGGEGTMKMITIGTIIAIGFAVLLITNKKMTVYQD